MKALYFLIATLVMILILIIATVVMNLTCPNWPPSHKEMSHVVTYTDLDRDSEYIAF